MRTIGVVTTSRADYGIYTPILRGMQDDPELTLRLLVSGTHLSPEFGRTVEEIEADGLPIADRVEVLLSSDSPEGTSKAMGVATLGFAQVFARSRPDILLVLGDRFEMHAATVAAVPFGIPIAHLHGGELSEGAIDEVFRHSLTKLSHLHFVATEAYARRVIQMGEEPWRVICSGAPSLDNLKSISPISDEEYQDGWGLKLAPDFLLVTFHPATREAGAIQEQAEALVAALARVGLPVVITMPNADMGGRVLRQNLQRFVGEYALAQGVENLGTRAYFGLMARAGAMVGNSSSGIIEAATFKLPVVNIGSRQQGRLCAENVLHVESGEEAICDGIRQAVSEPFRRSLKELKNPYGDGDATPIILETLKKVPMDQRLLLKCFHDLNPEPVRPS